MNALIVTNLLLVFSVTATLAAPKITKDVSYGPHKRNVMDIYWDTDYTNAPIVVIIHGGAFKHGSKAYCSPDMQTFYRNKGYVIVAPNYRLLEGGGAASIKDCLIDCAMAAAQVQANAETYGGDATRIISTGNSAGGYLSAQVAYKKTWRWPKHATHKPDTLNIIGWYGDSPYLPQFAISNVAKEDPPGFIVFGEHEHPGTPPSMGRDMQAALNTHTIWNKLIEVKGARHCPGKRLLFNTRAHNKDVRALYNQFLDHITRKTAIPDAGDILTVPASRR